MQIEGVRIPRWLFQVDAQTEVGEEAYQAGAHILQQFFAEHITHYLDSPDLDPLGRQIIACCLAGGSVQDYEQLIPRL
jgi:hypothetical protein